jgi:hypothetical protein
MDCRGKEKREQIVKEYNVIPIIHAKLLKGQTKYSDASALITDQYYIFECIHKVTREKEIIQCGMGAAKHLIELTNNNPLPLFNLLKTDGETRKNICETGISETKWNEMAKQLYNAVMILIVDWNAKPGTPLFDIKKEAENYKNYTPVLWRIKKVNNIIAKDYRKRKLSEILEDLKKDNDIKDYKFDLLDTELKANGISSNF